MAGPGAFVMGAVAYDPKVVTIWDGFRAWLRAQGLPFDYVLYSNYERQVEDLLAGRLHAAWNSPLAWVRAARLAAAQGLAVRALVMRDTDRDLTSVIVVRPESGIERPDGLRGKVVATGAVDSPQATLLPLGHLRAAGLEPGADFRVRRFDVGVGLHGDHIGGERAAARALVAGEVDAACLVDGNHLLFGREGTLPAGSTRVLAQTASYDHCNMTTGPAAPDAAAGRFGELLLAMSYADAAVRPLLDLEGLKAWCPGRTAGYAALEAAVDAAGFYDREGHVTAADYRP
jgi:ABC-type phosphate/phosphonate transport system substrate-binding protein